ncbi:MAG: hypothetical protein R3D45_05915 [Rhizobiaceae bacterium]
MPLVYISSDVRGVRDLHPYLSDPGFRNLPILKQIEAQAETIFGAFRAGDNRVAPHLLSWWPKARGATSETVLALDFAASDAFATMSREYGFSDTKELISLGNRTLDANFETALDHILAGEIEALRHLLDRHPELAAARSNLGHRSTLLHYLGANGVETHRQVTPYNAADLARLLISKGAARNAKADMYGGGQTPYMLACTSAHPIHAGISEALNAVLRPLS